MRFATSRAAPCATPEARRDEANVRSAEEAVDAGDQSRIRPIRPNEELRRDEGRDETRERSLLHLVEERVDGVQHCSRSRPLEPVHERCRVGDEAAALGDGS